MKRATGFTFVELMIVLWIISILAAVAIPAYTDYLKRTRIMEGLVLTIDIKQAVQEYYVHHGTLPADNAAAGLPVATALSSREVQSMSVEAGAIHIVYRHSADYGAETATLSLQPVTHAAGFARISRWACNGNPAPRQEGMQVFGENRTTVRPAYLPSHCK